MPKKVTCPHCGATFELPKTRKVRLSGIRSRSERSPKEFNCPNCKRKIKDDEI